MAPLSGRASPDRRGVAGARCVGGGAVDSRPSAQGARQDAGALIRVHLCSSVAIEFVATDEHGCTRMKTDAVQLESSQAKCLILRSRAKRGVSKDGNEQNVCCPPFETRPAAAPQGEVILSR